MMIQAISALLVVCLAFNAAQADVNTLCAADTCGTGTVCRVVSNEAHCLTCVPEGADSTCNLNGYWKVVLAGDVSTPGSLTALACGEMCPEGATCVNGVCCYGSNGSPVTSEDPICSSA